MDYDSNVQLNTEHIVTKLVDSWNVGIKRGSVGVQCRDKEAVKRYMTSVGITVYLEWDWQNYNTNFIMVKTSEADVVPNPLYRR
jgi:hypothetical protein